MIAFKVDVGYYNEVPNNISDIIWTDKGRPLTIPESKVQIGGRVTVRWSSDKNQTIYNALSLAQEYIGNDVDSLYAYPQGYGYEYYGEAALSAASFVFPSLLLGCPNLIDYLRDSGAIPTGVGGEVRKYNLVVHFTNLKKLYYGTYPGHIELVLCNVGEDGSLRVTGTGGSSISNFYNGVAYLHNLILEKKYTEDTDLSDINNYYLGGFGCNGYNTNTKVSSGDVDFLPRSQFSTGGYSTMLKFLFTKDTRPDIDLPENPYEPGGPSGPTDPDLPPGTFDDESDPIPDSPLPTLSAANTGFTRIYNPTLSQVQALARYLWTDPDVIQTIWNHIKQFFEDPMEAIIGFNLVPVPVPDGGIENFALMYIDTGVQMTVAANQFVDLDCGTLELKRYYGSALDQSPYTKVSCYLPYIGTVNLNTDEVMGTILQVKYRVDIVSGSCVAKIFVDGNCLYQYSGHCAITIPISSADFSSYVSAAISVGKLAATAITAGAGVAMAAGVGEVAQQTNQVVTTTQITSTARNPATGRQITTGTTTTVQTRESPADQSSTQASFSGLSPQNVANTVGAIMSSKPHIEHSGSFSGNSGYLGVRRPFVIIERPNMCMPANYQALNGFPAMITMELGTCKGFTRVQQVQLTGLHATNPEQAEILELLKSGVIL